MYDVNSKHADDFINHEEILDTLAYEDENKNNMKLIDAIIEKAKTTKRADTSGSISSSRLFGRRKKNKEIYKLAEQIKKRFLWKPNCDVCTTLPVKLLCQRLYLLPVPREKQTYYEETALSGRDPKRSHRTSGYGT